VNRHNGFTIIEVLVVVAIFILMVAVLTPFVRITRMRAASINCADNLREISLGLHAYAADQNGAFPPNLGALYPNYVQDAKVFDCPASKAAGTADKPDYIYIEGLKETSPLEEVIVYDLDGNHKRSGRNVLRLNGSVGWVAAAEGKPR